MNYSYIFENMLLKNMVKKYSGEIVVKNQKWRPKIQIICLGRLLCFSASVPFYFQGTELYESNHVTQ